MSLFKPLCKFCASVRSVREIVPTVRKALAIAQSGTPGTQQQSFNVLHNRIQPEHIFIMTVYTVLNSYICFSGPVFIEFPIDTLYPYHVVEKEISPKSAPKGIVGKVISWYDNDS